MTLVDNSMYPATQYGCMQEEQRQLFGQYISHHQEYGGDIGEPLQMALVLGGEKPATMFDPPEEMFSRYPDLSPSKLVKKWGLYYRRSSINSTLMVSPSYFWFDLLPAVELGTEIGARCRGLFFGYPFDAINHFLHAEGAILPGRKYIVQGEFSAEELAYSVFTFYRPEDSKTGYERAINIGKKRYNRLHELAHEWELSNLAEMTDRLYSDFTIRYSEESVPANNPSND